VGDGSTGRDLGPPSSGTRLDRSVWGPDGEDDLDPDLYPDPTADDPPFGDQELDDERRSTTLLDDVEVGDLLFRRQL